MGLFVYLINNPEKQNKRPYKRMTEKNMQNPQARMHSLMKPDHSFSSTTSLSTRCSSLLRKISVVLNVIMDADILVHWTSASSEAIVYEKLNYQGSGTDLVVMFQNIELFGLLRDVAYDMWESDMWESGDMNHDDEAFEGRLFYSRRPWEIWLNSSSWSEGKQQNGVRYITHSWQRSATAHLPRLEHCRGKKIDITLPYPWHEYTRHLYLNLVICNDLVVTLR